MKILLLLSTLIVALITQISSAHAALLDFEVESGGVVDASWQMSSTPKPFSYVKGIFTDIAVNGTDSEGKFTSVAFYNTSDTGGLTTSDFFINISSAQLYTGTEANPIFRTGTYILSDCPCEELIITDPSKVSSVPLPPSIYLFISAFAGLVGFAFLKTRKDDSSIAAFIA